MDTTTVRMTSLFNQLGLDSSAKGIARFISTHHLNAKTPITQAPFWNNAQRQLLQEWLDSDADWAIMVDELSTALTSKTLH